MCCQFAFYNQFWINTWRSELSKRQTVFFLPIDPRDLKSQRSWKDWLECTTSCTILAQCMEETSRRGIFDRHQSCDPQRIDILSDSIEFDHSSRNTSSLLVRKLLGWKLVKSQTEKYMMSPRPPPMISLRHDWTNEMGSKVVQQPESATVRQPEREVVRQTNQPNQLQIQFVIDQGDLLTCNLKEKRSVLMRSTLILFTKNSVLQIEHGDLLKQR